MADKKKMTDEEFQAIMHGLVSDAVQYTDEELTPERAKAADYYKAEKLGNEEEGRSQLVLSEVRDGVLGMLPSLLRLIFGPERVVEFVPKHREAVAGAAQATDYVQTVFVDENAGFMRSLAVLKDGLIKKLGVFKWDWNESRDVKTYHLPAVVEGDLETLLQDPDVELVRAQDNGDGTVDAEVKYTEHDGCPWVREVPPEEFLCSRDGRSLDDAVFVAHRRELTTGELLALGVSQKDIDEYGGTSSQLDDNEEEITRRPQDLSADSEEGGEANDKHLYIEAFPKIDFDGDGIAELRKVCTLGTSYHVVKNTTAEERPFSMFCPDPEPHAMIGGSMADRLMDIQRSKSMVMRSTLDSLAASIYPRTAYQEGMVSVQDILNTEIGAPIRTLGQPSNVIFPFTHPFVGKEAFPVLSYFDDVVERRTGRNKGTIGLDADALQSTTKDGVNAAVTSSQEQTELVVRIFCEQALKPLFRGLLRMLVKYQPRERMAKLRGEWVPVNPATWDAGMDVTVNVALGMSNVDRKLAVLGAQKATQEAVLQTLGPSNPLVTLAQYRYTLAQILELSGRKDVDNFYQAVPADWQPPPAPEPPPSPEMALAQAQIEVERQRSERELVIKEAELQLKRLEIELKDDRERDKNAADVVLRIKELELTHQVDLNEQSINAEIERERMTTQAETDRQQAASQPTA